MFVGALCAEFESRVILDGSQTNVNRNSVTAEFESRVILDGSQTKIEKLSIISRV